MILKPTCCLASSPCGLDCEIDWEEWNAEQERIGPDRLPTSGSLLLFPILGQFFSLPLEMLASHAAQIEANHHQSLERLAQRGGLDWCEALAILEDRPWREDFEAEEKVRALVAAWVRGKTGNERKSEA
jgi:hypothetical protein